MKSRIASLSSRGFFIIAPEAHAVNPRLGASKIAKPVVQSDLEIIHKEADLHD
ncbi:MAG: hypothetical protein MRZ54_08165 [Clostridiales bacterium]|nr:hypothetical protein [Clostridiales bacterium]